MKLPQIFPLDENNKIQCATCHTAHGVPSGEDTKTTIFMRTSNIDSAMCRMCHPDEAYIEKTVHDLIVSAPLSINIANQTPAESGTCGVCHLVHNSKNKIKLWAQGFGMGYNVMERMCNSCHSETGCAKNKTPQVSFHPREKLIKNIGKNIKGRPNYFPLFHGRSGEPVTEGNISCPSCHNVHQWNPKIYAKGKGINLEGDATSSFLRPKVSRELCVNCHEKDASLKIEYFHDARKRRYKGVDTPLSIPSSKNHLKI